MSQLKYVTRSHDFHQRELVWPETRWPVFNARPWDKIMRVGDYALHLPVTHDPQAAYPWDDKLWMGEWVWGGGGISEREAHFWFVALTSPERHTDTRAEHTSVRPLRRMRFSGSITLEDARARLTAWFDACDALPARARRYPYAYLARLLRPILPAHDLIDLIFELLPAEEARPYLEHVRAPEGAEARALAADAARRHLSKLDYTQSWAQFTAIKLLSGLDVPSELTRLVDTIAQTKDPAHGDAALAALALIEDDDAFVAAFEAMPAPVRPSDIARLFYRGKYDLCPTLFARVRAGDRSLHHSCFERLMNIHSPESAAGMLDLASKTSVASAARAWLLDEGHNAIVALASAATSPTHPRGELALDILREFRARGREVTIEEASADIDPEVWARLEPLVFERAMRPSTPWPQDQWPDWFAELAADSLPAGFPDFVSPDLLPRLVTRDDFILPPSLVNGLLARLRRHGFDPLDAALPKVRELLNPNTSASFAWAIFELWLDADAPAKHKFCVATVGWFGDREATRRLVELADTWPRENHIARARWAVDAIRLVDDSPSLLTISRFARKAHSKGLRAHAAAVLDGVAAQRGLSADELEDRLVPDCGLGDSGEVHVDLGSRAFDIVLLPGMVLAIRDAEGDTSTRFPRARVADDPELYRAAKRRWTSIRNELNGFARAQRERFEEALSSRRTWRGQDLLDYVVDHPILTSLAQQLVWEIEPEDLGGEPTRFIVARDRSLLGLDDEAVTLEPFDRVSLLHPAITPPAVVAAWSGVLADDEIIAPFPQLDRRVVRLSEDASGLTELRLDVDAPIALGRLRGWAARHGWERGDPQDAGSVTWFLKRLPRADATAFMRFDPGFFISGGYEEDQRPEALSFASGTTVDVPVPYYVDRKHLALEPSGVDVVALSEVLLQVTELATLEGV